MQTLQTRTNELTRLDDLNRIIRGIDQALVQADTREEIQRVVCQHMAASALYEFAWFGEYDMDEGKVVRVEWAGVNSRYLDNRTITTDDNLTGHGPISTAVRTREMQVVEDIATDVRCRPWREATLVQGGRSCVSLPLVYEDILYGVLCVYTARLDSDANEREVLDELGERIAYAINAIESKETLRTDTGVEISLALQPSETILGRLAVRAGCGIEFEGFVPLGDDVSDMFFIVHGAPSDEIQTGASGFVAIESLKWITDQADGSRSLWLR